MFYFFQLVVQFRLNQFEKKRCAEVVQANISTPQQASAAGQG
jgi:hypothetical protein